MGVPAASRPANSAGDRVGDLLPGRRQRGAVVEAHRDIGAEGCLDGHGVLGGQFQPSAVQMGAEGHPGFGQLHAIGHAEDLEAARVGQDRPVPGHHPVQPAEVADHILAGSDRQVIGVRQQHPATDGAEVVGGQPLDRRPGCRPA